MHGRVAKRCENFVRRTYQDQSQMKSGRERNKVKIWRYLLRNIDALTDNFNSHAWVINKHEIHMCRVFCLIDVFRLVSIIWYCVKVGIWRNKAVRRVCLKC